MLSWDNPPAFCPAPIYDIYQTNLFSHLGRQNAEELQSFYQGMGITAVFQLNPGNHYNHNEWD